MALPYRKVISGDDIDGYLAEAPELPGCVTTGATIEEAEAMLHDAMEGWVECALAAGEPIPEPQVLRAGGYLRGVQATLSEWATHEDEEAYRNL